MQLWTDVNGPVTLIPNMGYSDVDSEDLTVKAPKIESKETIGSSIAISIKQQLD